VSGYASVPALLGGCGVSARTSGVYLALPLRPPRLLYGAAMNFIRSRLRRLEKLRRGRLRCPGCGLMLESKGYIVVDGNDPAPEVPEVCPECGRNTRLHIVVVYEDEEGEGGGADGRLRRDYP
jgi:hypothetical protein